MIFDLEAALGEFIAALDQPLDVTVWDRLIDEEIHELVEARYGDNPWDVLKESLDVIYVIVGYLVANRIEFNRAMSALHDSNMSKFRGRPLYRDDGKLMKPDGWVPPDLTPYLGGAV